MVLLSLSVPGLAEKRPSVLVGKLGFYQLKKCLILSFLCQVIGYSYSNKVPLTAAGTKGTSTSFVKLRLACASTVHSIDNLKDDDSMFDSNSTAFLFKGNTKAKTAHLLKTECSSPCQFTLNLALLQYQAPPLLGCITI